MIEEVIENYLSPVPVSGSSQLLSSIKNNEEFGRICDLIGYAIGDDVLNGDKDYLVMKMSQKSSDGLDQLRECVMIMQERQFEMDCLISELQNKKKWIQEKSLKIKQKKHLLEEDCEVLQHQNKILQEKSRESIKKEQKTEQSELKQILQRYRCAVSFPKNKTEAMQLANRLDSQIQKLEIQKISLT